MMKLCLTVTAALCLVIAAPASLQEALEPIPPEIAHKYAKLLTDEAAKINNLQVQVEVDADKAVGVHRAGEGGILIVPQKDLKEDGVGEASKVEAGMGLAQLFMSHQILPVIDGKQVENSKLRTVTIKDDNGNEHAVNFLLLAVRQVAEDDYRLYAYGSDKKPLVDARFSEGTGPGPEPIAIEIKEVQKFDGTLVVTVFGKYQASFKVGYKPD